MIKKIIAFLVPSDKMINHGVFRFMKEAYKLDDEDQINAFCIQYNQEIEHALTYQNMLKQIITNDFDRKEIIEISRNLPSIVKKSRWIEDYISNEEEREIRLFKAAMTELVFFLSAFVIIFYFRTKNRFRELATANEYVLRDEWNHAKLNLFLSMKYSVGGNTIDQIKSNIKHIEDTKLNNEKRLEIINKTLELETKFLDELFETYELPIKKEEIVNYIKTMINTFLSLVGLSEIYSVNKNSLTFMDQLSIPQLTNFFERTVTDYSNVFSQIENDDPDKF